MIAPLFAWVLEYQGGDGVPRFEVFTEIVLADRRRREVRRAASWISLGPLSLSTYQTLDTRTVDEIVIDAVGPWIGLAAMVGALAVAWLATAFDWRWL